MFLSSKLSGGCSHQSRPYHGFSTYIISFSGSALAVFVLLFHPSHPRSSCPSRSDIHCSCLPGLASLAQRYSQRRFEGLCLLPFACPISYPKKRPNIPQQCPTRGQPRPFKIQQGWQFGVANLPYSRPSLMKPCSPVHHRTITHSLCAPQERKQSMITDYGQM